MVRLLWTAWAGDPAIRVRGSSHAASTQVSSHAGGDDGLQISIASHNGRNKMSLVSVSLITLMLQTGLAGEYPALGRG